MTPWGPTTMYRLRPYDLGMHHPPLSNVTIPAQVAETEDVHASTVPTIDHLAIF